MACAASEVGFEIGSGLDDLLLENFEDNSLFLSIFESEDSMGSTSDESRDRSASDEERSVSSSASVSLSLETLIPVPPQSNSLPLHMYPVAQAVQFSPAPVMMNLCSSVAMTGKRSLNSSGSSASTDDDEEFAKRQRKELRLMKNREAANRSRLKKKTAMEALEQQVEQLNQQVSALQQELAASRAECAALREQNDFLKSLVRTPGSDAGSESSSWQSSSSSPRARTSASTGSGLSSGVMVLAIVCAFTFVSDWFAFSVPGSGSASNSSSGYTAGGASIRGGRVLLSVDEDVAYGGDHGGVAMWDVQHMNWLARLLMYAGAMCIVLVVRQAVLGNTKHLLPF